MKTRNYGLIALILGVCLALGFGIGLLIGNMIENKKEKSGFVGKSALEIKDGKMTPEVLLAFGRLSDPQVSPDGKKILYGVSYTSVEDNRAVRNLYVSNLDGSDAELITMEGKSVSNARWTPDGKRILFLQGGKLYSAPYRNGALGKRICLSDTPSPIMEFTLSPDGGQILYTSTVKSHVDTPKDVYSDLQKASAYSTDDLMYRHWDHWVEEIPHSYISTIDFTEKGSVGKNFLDILGGSDVLYELPTEPFSGIEQLCWSPCGRYVAYSCRKLEGKEYAFSTNTEIYVYDILTGETITVTRNGGYDTDSVWSPDGKHLAWVSMERDGYEADRCRLFVADVIPDEDPDGQALPQFVNVRELSVGFDRNVASPSWSDDSSKIWFNALSDGVQGIFHATLDGVITRVTSAGDWHNYSTPFYISDEGDLYATWQSMNFPTELVKVSPEGESLQISHENDHLLSQMTDPAMEARIIKTVDGKDMLTWVVYPPQFDPEKVYPSILICLGGPQGTNDQSWSYRWNYRLMAEQGYIVVLPNRRGTTAFGQDWCEQISGDYCGLNMQDYMAAAKALKAEPYVAKMAACGASYGGYSVYYLAGVHGDLFDCFVAHAGIFNEEHMYYTTEEMWFPEFDNGGLGRGYLSGSPWSKYPEAVRHYANSPHKFVQNWHTPILCIHGGMDFRVPLDEGMAAFNCAQMMGVPSKLIVFPEENHWILQPQNALFWHREYYSWLDKWCK
ncbi:MAG: S9 family peptidase [Bacteroidales bacterium]|nr:S9 family peptidase [Bacteroidales bacterium]